MLRHQKLIGKFGDRLGRELLLGKQRAEIPVEGELVADHAQIRVLVDDAADRAHRVGLAVDDFDRRVGRKAGGKRGERIRDIACARHADREGLFLDLAVFIHRLDLVDLPHDAARILQKFLALGRDRDALGGALEDRNAEALLELLHGAAEVRLPHIEILGGLADGFCIGDLHRVFQMKNIHKRCTPSLRFLF